MEGGEGRVVTSVQDEIAKCVESHFGPAEGEMFLHAAGREDIDVRMLGRGRPFIFEFMNPKKALSCKNNIESLKITSPYVSCVDLKIVDKAFFDHLKEIEQSKAKSYAAVVYSKQPFT